MAARWRWPSSQKLHHVEGDPDSEVLTFSIIWVMIWPDDGGSKQVWNVGTISKRLYSTTSQKTVIFIFHKMFHNFLNYEMYVFKFQASFRKNCHINMHVTIHSMWRDSFRLSTVRNVMKFHSKHNVAALTASTVTESSKLQPNSQYHLFSESLYKGHERAINGKTWPSHDDLLHSKCTAICCITWIWNMHERVT